MVNLKTRQQLKSEWQNNQVSCWGPVVDTLVNGSVKSAESQVAM